MIVIDKAVDALKEGKVIAYPTEAVFGVGCDPDNEQALQALIDLKQRDPEKGLILIAANFEQLLPYVDISELSKEQMDTVFESWPGPVTWVMPVSKKTHQLVHGQFDSVAVRVTDHPLVQQICIKLSKPITSTSANLSGMPPCLVAEEVERQLGSDPLFIVNGSVGNRTKPSEIKDAKSLQVLRRG
ncbi:threonylcarbamoyl-AMP synthase [Vibrio sp. UCD-FRSSP16_10]|uniref:L-threonylcarbamoyladenylate synthase n=1 Tax=unclassified Vibrio TaxID=2614977 RepID=UPI0007FB8147|nr:MULTISPECIES: L-threonylcarbamoyladenylate synthase [unclassified Vibrio]OBT15656.1 threonylcarbamoyl-AMP synthase [Vibrio sp. UCD-FRSSP16_30]OBT21066.1 threonylcarbamoyl-AMP synthase [Vibrio sp. UCD-FRSSP16_10]